MKHFCTIPEAISEIRAGKLLILVDHPERENEGDLYIPADRATPQTLTTMIRYGGGLICSAITEQQACRLTLPLMVPPEENTETTKVNFTVSVNARNGITTGISAFDRTKTIKILASPKSQASDLTKPGHVFGLVAKQGGVLEREGHTEAAVDFARLAQFTPAGVLCEIIGDNGRMARQGDLVRLSEKLHIKMVSIADLIAYLKKNPLPSLPDQPAVVKVSLSTLPTIYGTFHISVYRSLRDNREHVALFTGDRKQPLVTRIHSQCLTGDTLFSLRCDCGQQLRQSMKIISKRGRGVILYLNQEGRGIGLANKIKAYALQDAGHDTVEANHALGFPADSRNYEIASHILKDLGIRQIQLLTNNPDKERQLTALGIHVAQCIALESRPNGINARYLATKKRKLGHRLRMI